MNEIIVIGGGIAGLTAAYRLHREGRDVLLLEELAKSGGHVRTVTEGDYRYETGPHTFMGSAEFIWKLVEDLCVEELVEQAQPASRNRYVVRDGRVLALPMGVGSFLATPLLSLKGKMRLALEPFIPGGATPEGTAWDFFVRRFGSEAATYMMGPFVSGVYAGDARLLGARAAFPKFWSFEREAGSMIIGAMRYLSRKKKRLKREGIPPRRGLYSFRGGIGRLSEVLAGRLGDAVRTSARVLSLSRQDGRWIVAAEGGETAARSVVLAVPPHRAAGILRSVDPHLGEGLASIPMAPVAVVHWEAALDVHPAPGFGFLVPRIYDLRVLGTLFPSELFAARAPAGHHLFASFYGGMTDPQGAQLSDSDLEARVREEHSQLLGIPPARPRILAILRYPHAIPQMLPRHPEMIAEARQRLAGLPGLFLAGNYLTGVGIEHAVESGFTASTACSAFLRQEVGVA